MTRTTIPNRIKELSQEANKPRVHEAQLAEEYDGVGQHVAVELSEGSTSVVYQARIASGDFGTGQTMPQGTPVSVFTYRGKIVVISMGAK